MVNLEAILFYGFAATALLGAAGVLLSRNIVRTAVWLLATLAAGAGLFFLLGAMFVGAIQLIVYAGGTLVLIIFGVMLTARDPRISFEPRRIEVVAGAIVCVLLAGMMIAVYLSTPWHTPGADIASPTGAFPPGDSPVQSGVGFVNNPYMLERVRKSVFRGPFRQPVKPSALMPGFHRLARRLALFEARPSLSSFARLLLSAARSL